MAKKRKRIKKYPNRFKIIQKFNKKMTISQLILNIVNSSSTMGLFKSSVDLFLIFSFQKIGCSFSERFKQSYQHKC